MMAQRAQGARAVEDDRRGLWRELDRRRRPRGVSAPSTYRSTIAPQASHTPWWWSSTLGSKRVAPEPRATACSSPIVDEVGEGGVHGAQRDARHLALARAYRPSAVGWVALSSSNVNNSCRCGVTLSPWARKASTSWLGDFTASPYLHGLQINNSCRLGPWPLAGTTFLVASGRCRNLRCPSTAGRCSPRSGRAPPTIRSTSW